MIPTVKSGDSRVCRQRDGKTRETVRKFLRKKVIHVWIGGSRDGPVSKITSIRGERPINRGKILGSGANPGSDSVKITWPFCLCWQIDRTYS